MAKPPPNNLEKRVAALEAQMTTLQQRVTDLEGRVAALEAAEPPSQSQALQAGGSVLVVEKKA